jgi:ribulose-phosphate 3-epimerase
MIIVPSIAEAKDFMDIEYKLKLVRGLASWVHLDVVDGEFAKPASWPYTTDSIEDEIKLINDLPAEPKIGVHLMERDPQEYLDSWIDTPVKRILVQYESPEHLQNALAVLDMSKIESGVVLALDTPVAVLSELPEKINFVQLMSINKIGHYGERFQEEIFDKIKEVKALNPKIVVSVDGGIKEEHLLALKKAGADQVVMGSAIFEAGDPRAELEKLIHAIS